MLIIIDCPDKPTNHQRTFSLLRVEEVLANLLTLRPTPEELVSWISHENEVDAKLKGTELTTLGSVLAEKASAAVFLPEPEEVGRKPALTKVY